MVSGPNLFDFMDYREYLRAIYDYRKQTTKYFSYRYLAQRVGVEASSLVRILHATMHLNDEAVPKLSEYLGFDDRESLYFECLVRFCKTSSDHERRSCFEKLVRIREFQTQPLQKDQFAVLSRWYNTVLRSLLAMEKEPYDAESLASRLDPPVSVEAVKDALELLLRLGLITQQGENQYSVPAAFLSPHAEIDPLAIRSYQHETLQLASRALDQIPKSQRDISTVTVSLDPKDLPALNEHIQLFRKSVMELSKDSKDPSMVYQLNLQFFPLTRPRATQENES